MGSKTAELVLVLTRAADLLRRVGATHWAAWLEGDARLISAGDFYGVEHLLTAFGGMGSLNDVSYGSVPELSNLLGRAHELASAIRREHQM